MAAATQPNPAPKRNPAQPTGHQGGNGTYTHAPRPAVHSVGDYAYQLRYGGFDCVTVNHGLDATTRVQVYRDANNMQRCAELSVESYTTGNRTNWQLGTELTAPQLEALAFALLDAAADIRSLEGGAA